MRVTGGASNLINGVSRQSPDVRLVTQLEESVNQWPTVSRGLVKRNPSIRKGSFAVLRSDTLVHLIERDEEERYVAEIGGGTIRVWDLQGAEKVVNAPQGWGYVAASGEDNYRAVTVSDHTFILNRSVTVNKGTMLTPVARNQALVHIVQGSYHTTYTIRINGSVAAQYTIGGGPWGDDSVMREVERYAKPATIASGLVGFTGTPSSLPAELLSVPSQLTGTGGTLNSSEWSVARLGSVIQITNTLGNDFSIDVLASSPELIRAHKGVSPRFSELPNKAVAGTVLKITGDDSSENDDYYVSFDKPSGAAEGRWKETHEPGALFRLMDETMPHLLVREADGTFTFKPAAWVPRKVGDDETNPWPSFVGKKVNGMVYAQNRLGLFTGESVAMSRHNSPFDFFKESLLSRLDTDPVDLTIAHPEVSNILHAVPVGDEIVLFTSSVQFRLSAGGDRLTNDNGSIKPILSVTAKSRAAPLSLGSRLYFTNDAASGSFVTEFLYDREGGIKAEEDVSSHVQGYLPGRIDYMAGDQDLRTLVLVGKDQPRMLFVYRWMTVGNERVQSAWQRWHIPTVNSFRALRVMGEELVLVSSVAGGTEVLTINLHEGWRQSTGDTIFLDRQVSLTGTYSPATGRTTFTVPYGQANAAIDASVELYGTPLTPTWVPGNNSFTLEGNWVGKPVIVGVNYPSFGVLSPLLYRQQNNQGAYGNAVAGMETWVSSVAFGSAATAFLEVDVVRQYRQPFRVVLTPAELNTASGFTGALQTGRLGKTVSVMARSADTKITFGSSTPHPYSITGLSWNGNATPVSY